MNNKLLKYLQDEFKKNNHPRYQKYFNEWVENLTENQMYYYNNLWLR